MTNLYGTQFPDFSTLQSELFDTLSPLCDRAELKIQYPLAEFDVASAKPTITVSIKNASIYNLYAKVAETSPFPVNVTLAFSVYVPKSSDSSLCYELFSEVVKLLLSGTVSAEQISCGELEYVPDLRHYLLKAEVKLRPFDTKEETNGNTDL